MLIADRGVCETVTWKSAEIRWQDITNPVQSDASVSRDPPLMAARQRDPTLRGFIKTSDSTDLLQSKFVEVLLIVVLPTIHQGFCLRMTVLPCAMSVNGSSVSPPWPGRTPCSCKRAFFSKSGHERFKKSPDCRNDILEVLRRISELRFPDKSKPLNFLDPFSWK